MSDFFVVTTEEMVAELERELKMRDLVYPNQVVAKRLSQREADRRVRVMRAALERLKETQA